MYNNQNSIPPALLKRAGILGACAAAIIVALFFIVPWYNVWQQEMAGKAEFAKAEQNRKIKIEEARANLEAIRIENGSITPTYIQYLWVRQQSDLSDKTVIYIPTETNLPILESTRMLFEPNAPK